MNDLNMHELPTNSSQFCDLKMDKEIGLSFRHLQSQNIKYETLSVPLQKSDVFDLSCYLGTATLLWRGHKLQAYSPLQSRSFVDLFSFAT